MILKKSARLLFVLGLSLAFFGIYNQINYRVPTMVNSPDENAHRVFIKLFAEKNTIGYLHPVDYGAEAEFIHPRSTFADFGNFILPVGFWGMIVLYGFIGKLIGAGATVYVTSLLTIASAFAWYGIWKKIFGERIAWYSMLLYLVHPVVWYYTARSLFPNVPFWALLSIGAYFVLVRPFKTYPLVNDVLGGLIGMISLLIRPNEIVWVGFLVLLIAVSYYRDIRWSKLGVYTAIGLLGLWAYTATNTTWYSSAAGGYIVSRSLPVTQWYTFVLPFGFNLHTIIASGYHYFIKLMPWLTVPAGLGLGLFIWQKVQGKRDMSKEARVYTIGFIGVAIVLFIYYGSLHDTLFSLKTIGVAYSRYWLPIHCVSLPFLVYGLCQWSDNLFSRRGATLTMYTVLVLFTILNYRVVYGGIDGLRAMEQHLQATNDLRTQVLALTEPSAILITEREDKFVWPDRQVMVRLYDPRVREGARNLMRNGHAIYYLTPTPNAAELTRLVNYLNPVGIQLKEVSNISTLTLYRFSL